MSREQQFTDDMTDLIHAAADLNEIEERGDAGSWEASNAYQQVLVAFQTARTSFAALEQREAGLERSGRD